MESGVDVFLTGRGDSLAGGHAAGSERARASGPDVILWRKMYAKPSGLWHFHDQLPNFKGKLTLWLASTSRQLPGHTDSWPIGHSPSPMAAGVRQVCDVIVLGSRSDQDVTRPAVLEQRCLLIT